MIREGPRRRRPRQRSAEGRAERVDRLVREGMQVAATVLEGVEQRDPADRVSGHERRDEPTDRVTVGEAEQVSDGIGREELPAPGEQLVEDRFGIAHPAVGKVRDEGHGLRLRGATVGGEDPAELALDEDRRQRPEIEALDAREDRGTDLAGIGGAEDEQDVRWRLFKRLEEDVPALRDALDLVDDEDLRGEVRRRRVDPGQQLADVVDPVVRGGIELHDIERAALADRVARGARVARLAVRDVRAVDRLGEDPRERGLARSARTDEQIGVAGPAGPQGVADRGHDGVLADDVLEALGPPAAIQRLVGGKFAHWAPDPGRGDRKRLPCTLRRSSRPRAHRHARLRPGLAAAPDEPRLALLPSGPDAVRVSPLRGTRSSTPFAPAALENEDLGREFSPAGADCRYRAPLVPRLARHRDHSRAPGSTRGGWRRGRDSNPRWVAPYRISSAAP